MSPIEVFFWLVVIALMVVGLPIVLIASMISFFRGKGSERRGGGGITAGVGAAMQELDRIMARPSIEHQVEAENQTLRRDEDSGSE
jgi:hypothetical protein